jgi:hypothetical protein
MNQPGMNFFSYVNSYDSKYHGCPNTVFSQNDRGQFFICHCKFHQFRINHHKTTYHVCVIVLWNQSHLFLVINLRPRWRRWWWPWPPASGSPSAAIASPSACPPSPCYAKVWDILIFFHVPRWHIWKYSFCMGKYEFIWSCNVMSGIIPLI